MDLHRKELFVTMGREHQAFPDGLALQYHSRPTLRCGAGLALIGYWNLVVARLRLASYGYKQDACPTTRLDQAGRATSRLDRDSRATCKNAGELTPASLLFPF